MANSSSQKKKSQNGKTARVKSNKTEHREIVSIVLFATGLLMFLSYIDKVGIVGVLIRGFLFGFFGQVASFLILGLIWYLAWCLLRGTERQVFTFKKTFLFTLLIIMISSLIHTISFDASHEDFFETVRQLIDSHKQKPSGGLLGGGLSLVLQKYMEKAGALVVLIPLTIIITMVLFSLSIMNFINKVSFIGSKVGRTGIKIYERLRNNKQQSVVIDRQKIKNAIEESEMLKDEYLLEEQELTFDDEIIEKDEPFINEPEQYTFSPEKIDVEETTFVENIISKEKHCYLKPPISLLADSDQEQDFSDEQKKHASRVARKIEDILFSFNIDAKVVNISRGPTITRYDVQPSSGVKVSKIKNLSEDIALNLASPGIRIEQIPGKAAIGVEVPNDAVRVVSLREIIDSKAFRNHRSNTAFCLGCDITGEPVVADIARMPHLLIAGATGSGKSVCINSLIMSLIYKASPDDVKLILIDPKVVELGIYNGIPHLMIPVVTQTKKAAGALSWAVQEMEKRYTMFAEKGVRDIAGYNRQAKAEGEDKLPKIVIIIDELADLMLAARDSVEDAICRIAQKARACGIHLVVATQRPSVDVITGLIKANIPSRIAFKVASQVDSRIILDNAGGAGADKLLGRGDMLFLPVGSIKPIRVQGAFVSDAEVETVVDYLKKSCEAEYDMEVVKEVENTQSAEGTRNTALEEDELLPQAVQIAIEMKQISASYLQRKLGIGYNRAARIIDQMEERGYISCKDGSNPRMVLIDKFPEELQGR